MSKLLFKEEVVDEEEEVINSSSSVAESTVVQNLPQKQRIDSVDAKLPIVKKSVVTSSTQLFDLPSSDEEQDDGEINNKGSLGLSIASFITTTKDSKFIGSEEVQTIDLVMKTDASAGIKILPQAGNQSSTAVKPVISANVTINKSVSSWLSRFLETKRQVIDPNSLAPDFEPSHDTYLQEFSTAYNAFAEEAAAASSKQKQVSAVNESISDDSSSSEDDDSNSEQILHRSTVPGKKRRLSHEKNADKDLALLDGNDVLNLLPNDEEVDEEGEVTTMKKKTAVLNIFNLPYATDVLQVGSFLNSCGIEFTSIDIGGSSSARKSLPVGAASVTITLTSPHETTDAVIQLLQGKSCGGRPVRVQKAYASTSRRSSGAHGSSGGGSNGRYFEQDDISTKCHICGQVGHKMQECTNEKAATPCHLCAGTDHDAGDCPNLLCYRCGRFGHHSRDCRGYSGRRPIICYQCGSLDHPFTQCPEYVYQEAPLPYHTSMVEGPGLVCVSCRRTGHGNCGSNTNSSSDHGQQKSRKGNQSNMEKHSIFCPNCGERGHHVDFLPGRISLRSKEQEALYCCYVPRCEAFYRFQQLQKDYEDLSEEEKDNYYRSIARNAYDLALFPSLTLPPKQRVARVGLKRTRDDDDGAHDYNNNNNRNSNSNSNSRSANSAGKNKSMKMDANDGPDDGKSSQKEDEEEEDYDKEEEYTSDYEESSSEEEDEGDDDDEDADDSDMNYHDDDEDDYAEDSSGNDDDVLNARGDNRASKRQRRDSFGNHHAQNSSKTHQRAPEKARNSKKKQVNEHGYPVHDKTPPSHAHHHKTSRSRKEKRQEKHQKKQIQHQARRNNNGTTTNSSSSSSNFNNNSNNNNNATVDRNWNRIRQQQTSAGASAAQAWQDRLSAAHPNNNNNVNNGNNHNNRRYSSGSNSSSNAQQPQRRHSYQQQSRQQQHRK